MGRDRRRRRGEGAAALATLAATLGFAAAAAYVRTSPRLPTAALVELAQATAYLRDKDRVGADARVRGYVEAGRTCMGSRRRPCVVRGDELTLDFGMGRYAVDVVPIEGFSRTVRHVAVESGGVIHVVDGDAFAEVLSEDRLSVLSPYVDAR